MKKLLISICCLSSVLFASIGFAHQIQSEDLPDYLGIKPIPLTKQEASALRMSEVYAKHGIEPFMTANGKLSYVHGASIVTVLASPLQVVDIELQINEQINEIILGDTARWKIEKGQVGNISHIFVKPIDANLETNLVITTNKRAYHIRLISTNKSITPYVGFIYSEDMLAYSATQKEKEKAMLFEKQKQSITSVDEAVFSLEDLNFAYDIDGKAKWKPVRIYDDNQKMYIEFPPEVASGMPILLVSSGNFEELVNYRVDNNFMIVDGVYSSLFLVLGVGDDEELVRITKED